MGRTTKFFGTIFVFAFIVLQVYRWYWPTVDLHTKDQILTVQIANTFDHQRKGLGGRSDMGKYDGMLFPFGVSAKHIIVMRDMEFPIDIVWLSEGEVVDIAPSVPIEPDATERTLTKYRPRAEANAVLELPAGWAKMHDLKIGDTVTQVSE